MSNDSTREYIAVVFVMGGSTFYRGHNREEVLTKVWKQAKRDWKDLVCFGKRRQRKTNIWDITGHDDVWWDDQGMYDGRTNQKINTHKTEVVVA